jgi:hypothetical protein
MLAAQRAAANKAKPKQHPKSWAEIANSAPRVPPPQANPTQGKPKQVMFQPQSTSTKQQGQKQDGIKQVSVKRPPNQNETVKARFFLIVIMIILS